MTKAENRAAARVYHRQNMQEMGTPTRGRYSPRTHRIAMGTVWQKRLLEKAKEQILDASEKIDDVVLNHRKRTGVGSRAGVSATNDCVEFGVGKMIDFHCYSPMLVSEKR
jgi:hypothetical protein